MEKDQLDLNEIAQRQDFALSIALREDPTERDSRLRREEAKAALERHKELMLYATTFAVVVAAFGMCSYIVLVATYGGETDKWATALLASIVTGLVGYATGKSSK